MSSQDTVDDDTLSIDVGAGVSRRTVMKQIGVASAALGLAGCQTEDDGTDAPAQEGDGSANGSTADFEFSRHPAVAPPEWDASKTREGSGQKIGRAHV